MLGRWHGKIQKTEDFTTLYFEVWDEYKEDKTWTSYGQCTLQMNIGDDFVNFVVYAKFSMNASGTWSIDEDNIISKADDVNFTDVTISSSTDLTEDYVKDLKKSFKTEFLPGMRDEMLKKDTTEIVLLNDTEYKCKGDDGTVYTMTKVK